MIHFFQQRIARRLRAVLCGDPSGNPPWLGAIAEGDGPGFFLPGDAPWIAHGEIATLVGGVRALLMQALHPGSLAVQLFCTVMTLHHAYLGSFVADALAMPGHWYYDREDLRSDYGVLDHYQAPAKPAPRQQGGHKVRDLR